MVRDATPAWWPLAADASRRCSLSPGSGASTTRSVALPQRVEQSRFRLSDCDPAGLGYSESWHARNRMIVRRLERGSDEAFRARFGGRLVVITGGSSGIGYAIAERLIGLGARIVLVADEPNKLDGAVLTLGGAPARVSSIACDIGDSAAVRGAMATLRREYGVPDVLVNCAGFAVYRAFEQSDVDEIERLLEVNFAGHVLCTKAVLDGMTARRQGHIVNIASVAGLFTLTPNAVYGAAKSGIIAWSRALRVELDRYGVGVSVVCPGRVETPFFEHETFKRRKTRRETELTVPLPMVVDAVLDAIRRNREIVTVPRYWSWFAYGLHFLPFALRTHEALLRRRVEDLY
jgi:short-subunit dehydrogenase